MNKRERLADTTFSCMIMFLHIYYQLIEQIIFQKMLNAQEIHTTRAHIAFYNSDKRKSVSMAVCF